ncbi:3-oxoadipate enol-lactonase [Novosphingobium sp.]|uniref:3-oxoadipate enol-lactonase n=1 Tax=Novosphingobium sp. TaxID=1874826 RepID=UPI003BAC0383
MTQSSGLAAMNDGAAIAWTLEGPEDGPVLLLSNSLGTSSAMWQPQLPAFAARYRVLRYDTRGHGQSAVSLGDYGLDRLGRDVVDLLDALGLDQVDFCGLSLGGMTGQWLGVFAPDRVRRLVLANTSAFMGPPTGWQDRMNRVRREGMAAIADAVIARWFTPAFASTPATAEVLETLLKTDPAGYAGCCAAIRDMDLRRIVSLIDRPTLVISGVQDPATPPEHAEFLHQAITGSTLVSFDASHLSNIEQPAAFAEAVLEFLD